MFTIDQSKFEEVVRIFNAGTDPQVVDNIIMAEITSDWHNADEHQEWLDSADAQEIADWLASFYS